LELAPRGPGDFEFKDGNSELAGRRPGRAHGPGREMKARRPRARCKRCGVPLGVGRELGETSGGLDQAGPAWDTEAGPMTRTTSDCQWARRPGPEGPRRRQLGTDRGRGPRTSQLRTVDSDSGRPQEKGSRTRRNRRSGDWCSRAGDSDSRRLQAGRGQEQKGRGHGERPADGRGPEPTQPRGRTRACGKEAVRERDGWRGHPWAHEPVECPRGRRRQKPGRWELIAGPVSTGDALSRLSPHGKEADMRRAHRSKAGD